MEPGLPRDEARNRVALLVPLSGANAGVGRSIANATMLALLDTQAKSVRITITTRPAARRRRRAARSPRARN